MDLSLSGEQSVILSSLDSMLARFATLPTDHGAYVRYSEELQAELAQSGFLAIAGEEDFGPLDAALVVERVARVPWSVEVAASALVGPLLDGAVEGPLALCEAIGRPTRYLPMARHACILTDEGLWHAPLATGEAETVDTVLSYPVGLLRDMPSGAILLPADTAEALKLAWQVAVAAEAAGLMRAALDATVSYVRDRRLFGRTLGEFQAVQHRLAICEQMVSASYLLAMRAAATMTARDAATALAYVQQHVRTVVYDCHQFTGAMGVTLEYPLHLWTYRLKFLQGELGGRTRQTMLLSQECWPDSLEGRTP